ncbi:MAG: carbohydrate binding family 9 domain-containing protein [Tannerellaceae bacterium]|jgi:hypothetical protein|nr:carbohydrate binding family 9 domain-containing protein [Tannerellaceae bacterium]
MKTLKCFFTTLICLSAYNAYAQSDSIAGRTFRATRTEIAPAIDGSLHDDCWLSVGEWSATFTQQRPDEGKPETEETHIKILYDNHNIYVAFQAYDSEPDKINRWLAPRDQLKGDAVCIIFDSYNDRRTGFAFILAAGGNKADFLCSNNDNDDYTWNAVWDGKVSHDGKGWYAEMSIPLSQLRYAPSEGEQQWGFTAIRVIDRKKEQTFLHLIPQINNGFVHSFGRLEGIAALPRSRRIELTPYVTARHQLYQKEEGNPYSKGSETGFGAGLDGKIGLSSDFTLDFTINPDFGQVEADPSNMNLTAFETYYVEKRPFFLEGKNIFNNRGEALFYSRRIGSRPAWSPDDEDGRYVKIPKETTIISALKVSGKSRSGLSVGLLNSLTSKETAQISDNGHEYRMTAQPFASYSVARVQQDLKKGNTIVGAMLTSTNRFISEEHLKGIVKNAYVGGIDFEQYFRNREYFINGNLQYSHVEGDRQAITRLQRSPVHYYQREGVDHLGVDSSRTALNGTAGQISIGRGGNNKIRTQHYFLWATPGFENNDLGYITQSDYKLLRGWLMYQESKPQGIFLRYNLDLFYRYVWDFNNTYAFGRFGAEANLSFKNKWYTYFCLFYDPRTIETAMLRGGPPVNVDPRWGTDLMIETDDSKRLSFELYHGTVLGSSRYAQFAFAQASYRPLPNLNLSARLTYGHWNKKLEYVSNVTTSSDRTAYLMGSLRSEELFLTLRMDYSITPDLSIQFYGNPFLSSGDYSDFKRATNPADKKYENRFRPLADLLSFDDKENSYSVTEANGDRYSFDNPDFSFREFRFNLVARWEYRPNSIMYLVWGQERSGSTGRFISSFSQNTKALFDYYPGNVFMIKLNYWFAI